MKNWLPNKRTVWVWTGALALAVWSLPNVSDVSIEDTLTRHQHHQQIQRHHVTEIPTMAVPQATPTTEGQGPSQGQSKPGAPANQEKVTPPQKAQPPAPAPNQAKIPTPAPSPGPGPGVQSGQVPPSTVKPGTRPGQMMSPYLPYPTAKLRLRVIDGRTKEPLSGAEVVVIETEQRVTTDQNGMTSWVDVPVIRDERFRPMVAQLHGQLGVIAYKNGYRDSIHIGIRMHEGFESEATVWMYKLGPGDSRIEPVLYQVPYHRIWLVELADRFRSKTQPGEGPERP